MVRAGFQGNLQPIGYSLINFRKMGLIGTWPGSLKDHTCLTCSRGCHGYWSIVFSVSSSKLALHYGNLVSLSHTLFRCLFCGKYGKGEEIIDELEITKRSPNEYIEVITLFKKTFEIKVSFIEFLAFYYPLFTFILSWS